MEKKTYQGSHKLPSKEYKEYYEDQAISLEETSHGIKLFWENGEKKFGTIQGRYGHEVKNSQENVHIDNCGGDNKESTARQSNETNCQRENDGDTNVGEWPCQRDKGFWPSTGFKVIRIVWYGLGPTKDEAPHHIREYGNQDRTNWVYVFYRI